MNESKANINWYPGHMARASRIIGESLRYADAVFEIVDARIPMASRNKDLFKIVGKKPVVVVLNRADQADAESTNKWLEYFAEKGISAVAVDSKNGSGMADVPHILCEMLSKKLERLKEKGMSGRAVKAMVVGVPNVGKSSFINCLAHRKAAKAENRPGVTVRNQWFEVSSELQLLDTPGVLPPKIEDRNSGLLLAFCGAVKDTILDIEDLASALVFKLSEFYPKRLSERYSIKANPFDESVFDEQSISLPEIAYGFNILTEIAVKRGFLISGGEADTLRAANMLIDEFRSGKLGRITLEMPPKAVQNG